MVMLFGDVVRGYNLEKAAIDILAACIISVVNTVALLQEMIKILLADVDEIITRGFKGCL